MYKTKIKGGFTLIELMLVVTIIIMLTGAIAITLIAARSKSEVAAFKSEVRSQQAYLANKCIISGRNFSDMIPAVPVPADTNATDWDSSWDPAINNLDCAPDGRFRIHAASRGVTSTCTATVTESDAIFNGC